MALQKTTDLASLLPRGSQKAIAAKLGVCRQAVHDALKRGNPANRIVIEAVRIAKESGALEAAQALNSLTA